jgi:limonene-1,2-epoxide hydrolase
MIENKTVNIETLDVPTIKELWAKTYDADGRPDWSHILPYYDDQIYFRDSIQEIRGIEAFKAMTQRLAKRSKDLSMRVVRVTKQENIVFLEWEMTIKYRNNPSAVMYGSSRLTINKDGKIAEQRDYFDLWGDIFDNVPGFGKLYRKFMRFLFG